MIERFLEQCPVWPVIRTELGAEAAENMIAHLERMTRLAMSADVELDLDRAALGAIVGLAVSLDADIRRAREYAGRPRHLEICAQLGQWAIDASVSALLTQQPGAADA